MRTIVAGLALTLIGFSSVYAVDRPEPATSAQLTPEEVIDGHLEAYNRRDIDAFVSYFAPDVRIYNHPDHLLMEGEEQLRRSYGSMFEVVTDLNASIRSRIVHGNFVVDHEEVTGLPHVDRIVVVVIYEVVDQRIQNVWFIR